MVQRRRDDKSNPRNPFGGSSSPKRKPRGHHSKSTTQHSSSKGGRPGRIGQQAPPRPPTSARPQTPTSQPAVEPEQPQTPTTSTGYTVIEEKEEEIPFAPPTPTIDPYQVIETIPDEQLETEVSTPIDEPVKDTTPIVTEEIVESEMPISEPSVSDVEPAFESDMKHTVIHTDAKEEEQVEELSESKTDIQSDDQLPSPPDKVSESFEPKTKEIEEVASTSKPRAHKQPPPQVKQSRPQIKSIPLSASGAAPSMGASSTSKRKTGAAPLKSRKPITRSKNQIESVDELKELSRQTTDAAGIERKAPPERTSRPIRPEPGPSQSRRPDTGRERRGPTDAVGKPEPTRERIKKGRPAMPGQTPQPIPKTPTGPHRRGRARPKFGAPVQRTINKVRKLDRRKYMEFKVDMRKLLEEDDVAEEGRANLLGSTWAKGERQGVDQALEFIREKMGEGKISEHLHDRIAKLISKYSKRR